MSQQRTANPQDRRTAARVGARAQHAADQRFAIELAPGRYLVASPLARETAVVEAGDRAAAVRAVAPPPSGPRPGRRGGELTPDFLVLLTTRGCNIACVYCDFAAGTGDHARLPVATGVAAIEFLARRLAATGRDALQIHFFGGEPFVAWSEVVTLCNAARAIAARHDLEVRFLASSNGVYPEARARWIAENFAQVMLSFDGPPEVHDALRPRRGGHGTFEAVRRSAEIFRDGAVDLYIRCCVTDGTVARMAEIAEMFAHEFAPSSLGFEPIKPGPATDAIGVFPPEAMRFVRGFAAAVRTLEPHGIPVVLSSTRVDELRASFCPVGNDGMVLAPDGTVASCYLTPESWAERSMDLRYAAIDDAGRIHVDDAALKRTRALVVEEKPRCDDCFARWHCAGGCHVDHTFPGADTAFDDVCVQTRMLTAWTWLRRLGLEAEAERWIGEPSLAEVTQP